jgi:hypothetical protein
MTAEDIQASSKWRGANGSTRKQEAARCIPNTNPR